MIATFSLAGGAWTFIAIVVFWSMGTLIQLYTRTGSGINQRPYGKDASVLNHDESAAARYTRGTRA
jgi:hypothetical protein